MNDPLRLGSGQLSGDQAPQNFLALSQQLLLDCMVEGNTLSLGTLSHLREWLLDCSKPDIFSIYTLLKNSQPSNSSFWDLKKFFLTL